MKVIQALIEELGNLIEATPVDNVRIYAYQLSSQKQKLGDIVKYHRLVLGVENVCNIGSIWFDEDRLWVFDNENCGFNVEYCQPDLVEQVLRLVANLWRHPSQRT